jgi:hypothetical protein
MANQDLTRPKVTLRTRLNRNQITGLSRAWAGWALDLRYTTDSLSQAIFMHLACSVSSWRKFG